MGSNSIRASVTSNAPACSDAEALLSGPKIIRILLFSRPRVSSALARNAPLTAEP